MTQIELNKEIIKMGDYGCLVYRTTDKRVVIRTHGKIKYIDSDGVILFKDDFKPRLIQSEQIIHFGKEDMLPPPTEYDGKPIAFDGGHWIYTESGKQVDLKR